MRFISVTKPGIIFGNVITVLGAFFLGSQGDVRLSLLLTTIVGMSLVMASGCVFNNTIDRDIDQLMERTKNRVLAKGLISPSVALVYATSLGIVGLVILYFLANPLTAIVASIGLLVYVVIYSLYAKRHSVFGTMLGAIAGAIPPVVGYCAATNHLDLGALLVFAILFFWQLPHSYAIAIYRLDDYAAASIPVLPIRKNIQTTKVSMLIFTLAFTAAAIAPYMFGYTGLSYLITALVLSLFWLYVALKGFSKQIDNRSWARKMFATSIICITLLSLMMAV